MWFIGTKNNLMVYNQMINALQNVFPLSPPPKKAEFYYVLTSQSLYIVERVQLINLGRIIVTSRGEGPGSVHSAISSPNGSGPEDLRPPFFQLDWFWLSFQMEDHLLERRQVATIILGCQSFFGQGGQGRR